MDPSAVYNSNVRINEDGSLVGAGGGRVNLSSPVTFTTPTPALYAFAGNKVTRAAGNGWDSKVISRESYVGAAYVSGHLDALNTFIGLTDGNANTTYDALDFSVEWAASGERHIYENGTFKGTLGSSFTPSTVWTITYDGAHARYYADGVLLRTVATTANRNFYAGVAIASAGSSVSNITFGPYTDRQWSNIANRDDFLIDGRIPAGLDGSGNVARYLPQSIKSNISIDSIADGITYTRYLATERNKLTGIEYGATFGADWASTLANRPGNIAALNGSEPINNALIQAQNLLVNGNAESGNTFGWQMTNNTAAGAALSVVAEPGLSGSHHFRVTKNASGGGATFQCRAFPVVAGQKIRVGCDWLGASSESGGGFYLGAMFGAATKPDGFLDYGTNIGSIAWILTEASVHWNYAHKEQVVTVPPGAKWMSVLIGAWVSAPTDMRFDNVFALPASISRFDSLSGRVDDPTFYNVQSVLGPKSTTNLVPTYTASGDNWTVNLPAHVRKVAGQSGAITMSFSSSSGVIAPSSYWVAYIDLPNGFTTAGAGSVVFSSDPDALLVATRYQIASGFTPIAPSSGGTSSGGSTGTGGGGGGGIDNCVAAESWMPDGRRAMDYCPGDRIKVLDEATWNSATFTRVVANRLTEAPVVELTSASGIRVIVSETTPCTMAGGACVAARDALGVELAVEDNHGLRWERIISVEPLGTRAVAHISAHESTYAAGAEPGRFIYTHNAAVKP